MEWLGLLRAAKKAWESKVEKTIFLKSFVILFFKKINFGNGG